MILSQKVYKLKQYFEKTGCDLDGDIYCSLKNKLRASICQAKVDYLKSSIAKSKPCPQMAAQMWSRVNSVLGRQGIKQDVNPSLSLDMINDHFQNIAVSNHHRSAVEYDFQLVILIGLFFQRSLFPLFCLACHHWIPLKQLVLMACLHIF